MATYYIFHAPNYRQESAHGQNLNIWLVGVCYSEECVFGGPLISSFLNQKFVTYQKPFPVDAGVQLELSWAIGQPPAGCIRCPWERCRSRGWWKWILERSDWGGWWWRRRRRRQCSGRSGRSSGQWPVRWMQTLGTSGLPKKIDFRIL